MYLMWNRLKYVLSPQFDIYNAVKDIVRDTVADIGFGTGFGTHLLTINADDVYGFEIDNDAINFARRVFPFEKLHFNFGDITKGISGAFNYVIMIDVIEHIADDKQAVKKARGMLDIGGSLILSTPNRLSRYRKAETHVREYSPKEFECLLGDIFESVSLRNHALEPLTSKYENPILAICEGK